MKSILVTGAAGNVGREVVRSLVARDIPVTAAHYDETRVRDLFDASVATVQLDFRDRSTWSAAVEEADHLFLMRPPAIADVDNNLQYIEDHAELWVKPGGSV